MLWAGALLVVVVAMLLFSRFSIDDRLSRDESIYVYAGQQLAVGVPPYVSIVDPKTPLATVTSAGAIAAGRALGIEDVRAVRIVYFALACAAAGAVFLAGFSTFRSIAAASLGAAAFMAFRGFAMDGFGGPNAKTPAVLLAAVVIVLLTGRRWFWSGVAASLAALVWQPLVIYVFVGVAFAAVNAAAGRRARTVATVIAGALLPAIVTAGYFVASRSWAEFVESAVLLPLTGTQRREATLVERIGHIVEMVNRGFGPSAILLWGGIAALVVLVARRHRRGWADRSAVGRDPLVTIVAAPLLLLLAFSLFDFQGYDDAYPLLVYGALGLTGAGASLSSLTRVPLSRRHLAVAGASLALVVASLAWYSARQPGDTALRSQRRDAAVLDDLLGPDGTLYALGNPALLVLTERTNPSRYIFLSAGVDQWVVDHTSGGFEGWLDRILASGADAIHIDAWITANEFRDRIQRQLLRAGYAELRIGQLEILVTPELRDRAVGRQLGELLR